MRVRFMVMDETPESFPKKNGQIVNQQVLICMDMSREGARLGQPVRYPLSDAERVKYSTKLKEKFINLDLTQIETFGGAIKVRAGALVSVE